MQHSDAADTAASREGVVSAVLMTARNAVIRAFVQIGPKPASRVSQLCVVMAAYAAETAIDGSLQHHDAVVLSKTGAVSVCTICVQIANFCWSAAVSP